MNATPRQLRMFLALSESLNFSRTAEQFFVTQPSLSKAIRDLEEALGLKLFERTTRAVRLTPAGQRLVLVARKVVGEFDAGLLRLQAHAEEETRQLRIASLPSLANVLLPAACAALEQRYGTPHITIRDCSNAASIQQLANHHVDFSLASVAPSHPELHYEEVLRDRFVLLSAGRWRRRVGASRTLDELVELPLISMTDASTAMRYMVAAYLQRGMEFRPKMQFDQVGTIAGFVRQGLGVAVLPYLGMMPLLDLGGMRVSEISDGPVRSVGIVTRERSEPSDIARQAMQEVRAVARQLIAQHAGLVLPPGKAARR
ncbi:LysR family transcriptional regulator [Pseudorhodoferax soli]|uniref:DNA-binding transcriptional LysR family regulator n=1 Tax=Pseudorhodoferax soli TaxID=545864 RepID=A0A368XN44_9BURK|nr:LysR family transcriptional regulator [Pseudorhodoferax soli]RCW67444.1 DNA-binding transcriptional LysR family regulator [Pseudorhodoferax soli]